jgi:hypothetical protein
MCIIIELKNLNELKVNIQPKQSGLDSNKCLHPSRGLANIIEIIVMNIIHSHVNEGTNYRF